MNAFKTLLAALALTVVATAGAQTLKMTPQVVGVTTYEASTAVNLVVVKPEIRLTQLDPSILTVNTNGTDRNVLSVYPADARGAFDPDGEYLALGLEKATGRGLGLSKGSGVWKEEYSVKVGLKKGKVIKVGKQKYTAIECETDKALKDFLSEADYFNTGSFTGKATGKGGDETLTYAAYEPWSLRGDGKQNPLVIWLHGGGEGGVDVSITLLGNEVVSLIRPQIQSHFTTEGGSNGAYVLSIQCPTMWMNAANGSFSRGDYPSLYADVLKACIDNYVDQHPDVDRNRIYLGGCSNGGFMTMHMLIRHPKYFAAAYPTCEAYMDCYISDSQIKTLSEENIWIVQSFDDTTVDPQQHCIPTFQRLVKVGAKNVWMSMFENVEGMDTPGQKLFGHFSWCYLFNDAVTHSQEQSLEVKPSNDGGGTVAPQGHANIFEWMNAQVLTLPEMVKPQYGPRR